MYSRARAGSSISHFSTCGDKRATTCGVLWVWVWGWCDGGGAGGSIGYTHDPHAVPALIAAYASNACSDDIQLTRKCSPQPTCAGTTDLSAGGCGFVHSPYTSPTAQPSPRPPATAHALPHHGLTLFPFTAAQAPSHPHVSLAVQVLGTDSQVDALHPRQLLH